MATRSSASQPRPTAQHRNKVSPTSSGTPASRVRQKRPTDTPIRDNRGSGKAPNDEWWRGGVLYQIYPRSFQDSRGSGIGDLNGITQRLDYVAALGVDGIWLSPFFQSPMQDFGYDISDYRAVDPIFGTLDDFKALLARAHQLGLKVIIDQVLSHTSDQHPWFIDSRQSNKQAKADWYVWADAKPDGSPPNNWQSVFGGSAWRWDTRRMQYYLHNFLPSQPDLNLHNRKVQDALLADMRFWLELGVDGFRLDTVNFYFHNQSLKDNPPRNRRGKRDPGTDIINPYTWQSHVYDKTQPENLAFLKRLRALLDLFPNTTTVGEVGDEHALEVIAQYTADGDKLHMAYSFDLLNERHTADYLHHVFGRFGRIVKDGWPSWAISNHDCQRVRTRWAGQKGGDALARLAAALQMTLRGSPCIYQGDELGLPEAELTFEQLQDPYGIRMWPEFKGRDGCRTPFPWKKRGPHAGFSSAPQTWLPIPAEHRALAVDQQVRDPKSMLNFYRHLLAWRKTHPALLTGRLKLLPANRQLIAFERRLSNDALLCVFNFSAKPARLPLPRGWANAMVDPDSGLSEAEIRRGHLVLHPWAGAVLLPS
ncbi:MAG: alpha-glucosidase family protein [Lautropia sp.]|nr:alpha-glucosidase family protein [Lautropia sp.]